MCLKNDTQVKKSEIADILHKKVAQNQIYQQGDLRSDFNNPNT